MKVWIDQDLCTGDGLCEEIAPDVFTLLDDGLAYVKEGDKIYAEAKGNPQGAEGMASFPDSQLDVGHRIRRGVPRRVHLHRALTCSRQLTLTILSTARGQHPRAVARPGQPDPFHLGVGTHRLRPRRRGTGPPSGRRCGRPCGGRAAPPGRRCASRDGAPRSCGHRSSAPSAARGSGPPGGSTACRRRARPRSQHGSACGTTCHGSGRSSTTRSNGPCDGSMPA